MVLAESASLLRSEGDHAPSGGGGRGGRADGGRLGGGGDGGGAGVAAGAGLLVLGLGLGGGGDAQTAEDTQELVGLTMETERVSNAREADEKRTYGGLELGGGHGDRGGEPAVILGDPGVLHPGSLGVAEELQTMVNNRGANKEQ